MGFFGDEPELSSYATLDREQAERYLVGRLFQTMDEKERWRLLEPGMHFDDQDENPEKYATPELKYAAFIEDGTVFQEAWEGPIGFQLLDEIGAMSNDGLKRALAEQDVEVESIFGEPKKRFVCRCCGFLSLLSRHTCSRCPVCAWIDEHPEQPEHMPGNEVTFDEAVANFKDHGVADPRLASRVRTNAIYLYEHAPGRPDPEDE